MLCSTVLDEILVVIEDSEIIVGSAILNAASTESKSFDKITELTYSEIKLIKKVKK